MKYLSWSTHVQLTRAKRSCVCSPVKDDCPDESVTCKIQKACLGPRGSGATCARFRCQDHRGGMEKWGLSSLLSEARAAHEMASQSPSKGQHNCSLEIATSGALLCGQVYHGAAFTSEHTDVQRSSSSWIVRSLIQGHDRHLLLQVPLYIVRLNAFDTSP